MLTVWPGHGIDAGIIWTEYFFVCALVWFHTSEPLLAYTYMKDEFGRSSFLLSSRYLFAMTVSLLEHVLWALYVPWMRHQAAIASIGVVLIFIGDGMRKTAMVTAKSAFTHIIRTELRPTHHLITCGIYRYVRHPGYLGWLLWAVGLQLLLVNPVCSVAFALLAWQFFKIRIAYEELTLMRFFGDRYEAYRDRTPTWLPGIP